MSLIDLAALLRSLRPHRRPSRTPAIRTSAKSAVATASVFFAVFLFASEAAAQTVQLGSCTPGQRQCQADEVMRCECYEEWREIDGEETLVLVCGWEPAGESCGQPLVPPACTRDHDGATYRFPDGIKACLCYDDGCRWY